MSNAWATRPPDGDSPGKPGVIPDDAAGTECPVAKGGLGRAGGAARVPSACRRGDGPPRRRRVPGLRGRTGTLGLRYGPDSCGRQQLRIFRNGRKPGGATPRGRGRPEGCRVLLRGKKEPRRECRGGDRTPRIRGG